MAEKKRVRNPNFSLKEKQTILECAFHEKNIIDNKKTDGNTWKEKEAAWERITANFNSQSDSACYRTIESLRKFYQGYKKELRKAAADEQLSTIQTGGGKPINTNKENPKTSEVGPSSSNACTGLDNASIEEQPVDKIDIKDETYYFPSYGNSPSASQLDDYSQEEFRPPQISDPKKCNKRKRQIYEDDLSNPDLMTLKKNKLQLEIYNLRLDALKKEIDLGLPRSQFTEELYKNWDDVPIKEET
ncbi:myb/SANT-like DNA-binding domain-containing protein 4 isoform X4 [Episyrphus balteatus]|uniref:myb/SANT-like DNA-binding domain-containing protein 4 isoform X4 n=1 Tax=Episyrphus balteatus TaxID=286459 RepID=UPI0024868050|nr:myb/SANT-like DNA-binding domain-containing protein 4 isoform X4 [Episyrphus balteatus]